jgi:hypothetical protein
VPPKKTTARKKSTGRRTRKEQDRFDLSALGKFIEPITNAMQNLTWPKLVAIVIAITFGVWQYAGIKDGIADNDRRLDSQNERLSDLEDLAQEIDDVEREADQLAGSLRAIQRALHRTIHETVKDSLTEICQEEDPRGKSPLCAALNRGSG